MRSALAAQPPGSPHAIAACAITADGKTFYRADCPFIHGPVKMVDAQTAAREGYVPDPGCMHESLEE